MRHAFGGQRRRRGRGVGGRGPGQPGIHLVGAPAQGGGAADSLGEVVSDVEVAGEDPAFPLSHERVFLGDHDRAAGGEGDRHERGGGLVEQAGHGPGLVLTRGQVLGPHLVARSYLLDQCCALARLDGRSGDEAVAGEVFDVLQDA